MSLSLSRRIDQAVAGLVRNYPGPGGAVAVLREGEVLVRHAWGYANAEQRIAFTPRTLFRICSITKQFTCAAMLDIRRDLTALDGAIRAQLPQLVGPHPSAESLAHNQSGLRDYWAVAMLHGAAPEGSFGDHESQAVIAGTRSLQFASGSRFSYSNNNFRVLSNALEAETGRCFAELLQKQIFEPVGMETAFLAADTRAMPDGAEGYEGNVALGFRAAENRILWTGDAGMGASLDDMIAWERHIDATRDNSDSLYGRISGPVAFSDGARATYGFGLGRGEVHGRVFTGHGGALRGWRSQRIYLPGERVSVVVMFNHLSHAHLAQAEIIAAVLGLDPPPHAAELAPPDSLHKFLGAWLEPETGLSLRVEAAEAGQVRVLFGHSPEVLDLNADGSAGHAGMRLLPVAGGLRLQRPGDNLDSLLTPLTSETGALDVSGRYVCAELEAELTVADAGGVLYGAFSGFLGRGRMELLQPVGPDVWALPCPRALDHTPPGDWTLHFRRDGQGRVQRAVVGCWLARGLVYDRR